jgi:signal peptidase II
MIGRRLYLLVSTGVVVLDQVTKRLVASMIDLHDSHELVAGLASLTHVRNRGAAFGFLSNADLPYQAVLFSVLSVVALLAIAAYAFKLPVAHKWTQVALALIMGGAVGNLIDRMVHGFVIDFVDVYWRAHHWPAFNVADSCISIGVVMLVLELFRPGQSEPASPDRPQPDRQQSDGASMTALPHGE